eukprot:8813735-Heterocapsa_arctica.AAC.1
MRTRASAVPFRNLSCSDPESNRHASSKQKTAKRRVDAALPRNLGQSPDFLILANVSFPSMRCFSFVLR